MKGKKHDKKNKVLVQKCILWIFFPQSLLYCEIEEILVTLASNSHLRGFRGKTANTHEISQEPQTVFCILQPYHTCVFMQNHNPM